MGSRSVIDECLGCGGVALDNAGVRLGSRIEDGRRVRVVEWNPATSTDLSVLVLLVGVACVCGGLAATAAQVSGWVRTVLTGLAVLAGIYWLLIAIPAGLFAACLIVGKAMLAKEPTRLQQASFALPAIALGTLLGATTYEAGLPGLLVAPAVAVSTIGVVWPRTSSHRVRARLIALSGITVIVAMAVGCTIFL